MAVFEEGLKIAPGSALLTGPMKEAIAARDSAAAGGGAGGLSVGSSIIPKHSILT